MLRLRTFGVLSLDDGTAAASIGRTMQRRRLALLAVLAANRHRPVSRDKLLGFFWPERRLEEARHSLAQLVYAVRQELGDDVLLTGTDDLRTNPDLFGADVAEFFDALDRGDLESAVSIHAAPFLDGFFLSDAPEFERWVDETRGDLRRRCATALEGLARAATQSGAPHDAVGWWRRRAVLDALDSRVTQELMRALAASGDGAAAIRQAAIHASLLRADVDAAPDAAVVALAERIRKEMASRAPSSPMIPRPVRDSGRSTRRSMPDEQRRSSSASRRIMRGGRRAIVALSLGIMALLAASSWRMGYFDRARPFRAMTAPLVVLGAIDGPDSTLSLAVAEGLRSGLESDGNIRVLGEARTRATIALMARAVGTRLSPPVASEIAVRNGAALAIVGSALPVGRGIQIVAQALDPRTGDAVLTVSEHPQSADSVVAAIARIGERLRERATGVALRAVEAPLPPVLTSSLEALQDYALARRALARFDREAAFRFGEAALEEDSLFPMANYLVADLDWFWDRQRDCERHLSRALAMKDRLTRRERLLVQARYEQLVADQSDSALAAFLRLHAAYPDDGQAFEGMAWTYRAMGRFREAAAAADSALLLDSTTFAPSATNKLFALIDAGDTTAALAYARALPPSAWWIEAQAKYLTAIRAKDWRRALAAYPDTTPTSKDPLRPAINPYHHAALLYNGRLAEAALLVPRIRRIWPNHQFAPTAILAQARAELAQGGAPANAAAAAREVLAWTEAADLSAPAVSRLTERVAELAARAGDAVTIAAARKLLERRSAGRNLPSYRLALLTVDASAAFARGDMRTAAAFAEVARQGMFHGRSLAHIALLEADARAAIGQRDAANELYRRLLTPDAFAAGHLEVWPLFEQEAETRLARARR